jgi:hypothetical protein
MAGELVTVGTYLDPLTANMARSRLEDEGIRAFLADEEVSAMAWTLTSAVGGIKLVVAAEDATRATLILADPIDEDPPPPPPEESEGIQTEPPPPATGIRADAADSGDGAEDGPDEEGPALAPLDDTAVRAGKAALFGLLFFPLSFYAVYLVLDVLSSDEKLSPEGSRGLNQALLFLMPYFLLIAAIVFYLVVGPAPLPLEP